MRKNIKSIIVALVVSVGLIITSCGSNDTPSEPATEAVAEQEEQIEQTVEEETVEDVQESETAETEQSTNNGRKYVEIGDTIEYTYGNDDEDFGDIIVNVTNIGIMDKSGTTPNYYILYAELDVENKTSETVYMGITDTSVFIDDYQYNGDSSEYSALSFAGFDAQSFSINPGRKGKVTLAGVIDEASAISGSRIEMEIMDGVDIIIFKDNGEWLFGNDVQSSNGIAADSDSSANAVATSGGGIGNPVIDSNPDRYIPEGVSGGIDVIDECFYSDNGNTSAIEGEYLIVGGDITMIEISGSDGSGWTMSIRNSNKDDNEQLLLQPAENGSPSYWASSDNDFYTVSFFDGGMYVRTDSPDDENDWIEGFYEIL